MRLVQLCSNPLDCRTIFSSLSVACSPNSLIARWLPGSVVMQLKSAREQMDNKGCRSRVGTQQAAGRSTRSPLHNKACIPISCHTCKLHKNQHTATVDAVQRSRVRSGAAALVKEGGPQRCHLQRPAAEQAQVVLRRSSQQSARVAGPRGCDSSGRSEVGSRLAAEQTLCAAHNSISMI